MSVNFWLVYPLFILSVKHIDEVISKRFNSVILFQRWGKLGPSKLVIEPHIIKKYT